MLTVPDDVEASRQARQLAHRADRTGGACRCARSYACKAVDRIDRRWRDARVSPSQSGYARQYRGPRASR